MHRDLPRNSKNDAMGCDMQDDCSVLWYLSIQCWTVDLECSKMWCQPLVVNMFLVGQLMLESTSPFYHNVLHIIVRRGRNTAMTCSGRWESKFWGLGRCTMICLWNDRDEVWSCYTATYVLWIRQRHPALLLRTVLDLLHFWDDWEQRRSWQAL